MRNLNRTSFLCMAIGLFLSIPCTSVFGLILHPDNEPSAGWSGRPSSNVVGRWGSNASCVAISPDCVVTTAHQYGGVGTTVVIGGQTYYVARVERDGGYDVRVAKLRLANLSDYVSVYTGSQEQNKTMAIGGWGKGRGAELSYLGTVYGYQWAAEGNTTLRWGTNKIDDSNDSLDYNSLAHTCLRSDFDGPGIFATDYEAVIAEYDSGGGWFIDTGSEWQLAGLTFTVETRNEYPQQAWFKNSTTLANDPDRQWAHRVRQYAGWISTTASNLGNCGSELADITEDCRVNIDDLKELAGWWASDPAVDPARDRADINSDTAVNMLDFADLASKWNIDYW
jgi:malate synthase